MILLDSIRCEIDDVLDMLNEMCQAGDRLEIKTKIESKLRQVLTMSSEQHMLINARVHMETNGLKTYAEMVKNGKSDVPAIVKKHFVKPPETMLIYPSTGSEDSEKTFNALKQKINVKDLKINIQRVKQIRRGGIAVSLSDRTSSKSLRKAVHELDAFIIKKPVRNNPYIKIAGVSSDVTNEEITDALDSLFTEYNALKTTSENNYPVKYIFQTMNKKSNLRNVVVQLQPNQWSLAIEKAYINVQWHRFKMINCIPVKRCYRCQSFGHTTTNCPSEKDICSYCSGNHDYSKCKSESPTGKCSNCVKHNTEYNLNHEVNHPSNSSICPVFKSLRLKLEQSIKYYHA